MREVRAALEQRRVVSSRERADERVDVRAAGAALDRRAREIPSQREVLRDRAREDNDVLEHEPHVLPQRGQVPLPHVDAFTSTAPRCTS